MSDQELDKRLTLLAIDYTKLAFSKAYQEAGVIELGAIEKNSAYATNEGTAHCIILNGSLKLVSGGTKIFKSKAQFFSNGQAVKPQLLELKFTSSNRTLQFYFREEGDGDQKAYQMWGSNYLQEGVEQNKTG
jgi:hypothetical protein